MPSRLKVAYRGHINLMFCQLIVGSNASLFVNFQIIISFSGYGENLKII